VHHSAGTDADQHLRIADTYQHDALARPDATSSMTAISPRRAARELQIA
jgi:hypothetical protein